MKRHVINSRPKRSVYGGKSHGMPNPAAIHKMRVAKTKK